MLTGGIGARASDFFQRYGIQTVTGAEGTVRQAVDTYQRNRITSSAPCHESSHDCRGEHLHNP